MTGGWFRTLSFAHMSVFMCFPFPSARPSFKWGAPEVAWSWDQWQQPIGADDSHWKSPIATWNLCNHMEPQNRTKESLVITIATIFNWSEKLLSRDIPWLLDLRHSEGSKRRAKSVRGSKWALRTFANGWANGWAKNGCGHDWRNLEWCFSDGFWSWCLKSWKGTACL